MTERIFRHRITGQTVTVNSLVTVGSTHYWLIDNGQRVVSEIEAIFLREYELITDNTQVPGEVNNVYTLRHRKEEIRRV